MSDKTVTAGRLGSRPLLTASDRVHESDRVRPHGEAACLRGLGNAVVSRVDGYRVFARGAFLSTSLPHIRLTEFRKALLQ